MAETSACFGCLVEWSSIGPQTGIGHVFREAPTPGFLAQSRLVITDVGYFGRTGSLNVKSGCIWGFWL